MLWAFLQRGRGDFYTFLKLAFAQRTVLSLPQGMGRTPMHSVNSTGSKALGW